MGTAFFARRRSIKIFGLWVDKKFLGWVRPHKKNIFKGGQENFLVTKEDITFWNFLLKSGPYFGPPALENYYWLQENFAGDSRWIFFDFLFQDGQFRPLPDIFCSESPKILVGVGGGHKSRAWGVGVLFGFREGSIKQFLGGRPPLARLCWEINRNTFCFSWIEWIYYLLLTSTKASEGQKERWTVIYINNDNVKL